MPVPSNFTMLPTLRLTMQFIGKPWYNEGVLLMMYEMDHLFFFCISKAYKVTLRSNNWQTMNCPILESSLLTFFLDLNPH